MPTFRIVTFLAVGAVLLFANLWFLRSIWSAVFGSGGPNAIAPFQIVSKEPMEEGRGAAMAHLLRARLGRIRREMESSAQSLEGTRIGGSAGVIQLPERPLSLVTLPDKVFQPISLNLTVAGVEVGGLVSWLHRLMAEDRVLRIVVEYQDDQAIVVGNTDRFDGSALYILRESDTDQIVTGIAYTLTQREMSARIPEMGALDLDEFETLLTTLHSVAELNRKVGLGRVTEMEFDGPLMTLKQLVEKTPQWRALVHLTAQVAENAKKTDEALELYQMELALLDADEPARVEIASAIKRLTPKIVTAGVDVPPVPRGSNNAAILTQLRKTPGSEALFSMSGVISLESTSPPQIAILGGRPSDDLLPTRQFTLVGAPEGALQRRPFEAAYIDSLVHTVQLIAPNTHFVFSPSRAETSFYTAGELEAAWRTLVSVDPDVLLVTLGPLSGVVFERLILDTISRGIIVVFAETPPDQQRGMRAAYEGVLHQVMVVASVRQDGTPLFQASTERADQDDRFWALGEDIPVYSLKSAQIEPRGGNSYAAAVAAAIAGRVTVEALSLPLTEQIDLLRKSSRPVAKAGQPALLNLESALADLRRAAPDTATVARGRQVVEQPIPDNTPSGLDSDIHINESGKLLRLSVNVRISHSWIGDLKIALTAPDGTTATLHDRTGGSGDNLMASFSSDGLASLATLRGKEINGDWRLNISDHASQDTGTLHEWDLNIAYEL